MSKLLSILIPTYNRASFLKDAIICLLPQFFSYEDKLEILVSDNCSSDDTKNIIDSLQDQFHNQIIYHRQSENIGFEANFEFLVNKSQGKYLYLMGDDDLLSTNFLQTVISLIDSEKKYSIVHWNRLKGDSECDNNVLVDSHFFEVIKFFSPSEFILNRMTSPNFISSLIFSRECWDFAQKIDLSSFYGYQWFGRVYWGAILTGHTCLYYYFPLSIQRVINHAWQKDWPIYSIIGLGNIFKSLDCKIDGLYNSWQKLFQMTYNPENTIRSMGKDQKYYRNYESQFVIHLNKHQIKLLKFWLYTPFPKISFKVHCFFRRFHINIL